MNTVKKKREKESVRLDEESNPLEFVQKIKFAHTTKWWMTKPESVLDNETHKFIWNLKIKMYHQNSARSLDLELVSKKKNGTGRLSIFTFGGIRNWK